MKELPDGTLPDLIISDGGQKADVEVKGHENRQAKREDVLQLVAYISEEDKKEKGIFVANHEFSHKPDERNKLAFTEGAVDIGSCNNMSLLSTVDLYNQTMKVIEAGLDEQRLQIIRNRIMDGKGRSPSVRVRITY